MIIKNSINNNYKIESIFYNKIIKNNLISMRDQTHPFHLVDPSPWPILGAFTLFIFLCSNLCKTIDNSFTYRRDCLFLNSMGVFYTIDFLLKKEHKFLNIIIE